MLTLADISQGKHGQEYFPAKEERQPLWRVLTLKLYSGYKNDGKSYDWQTSMPFRGQKVPQWS